MTEHFFTTRDLDASLKDISHWGLEKGLFLSLKRDIYWYRNDLGEEQTMSYLVPISPCQEQFDLIWDSKCSSMIISC